jgi:hypothetical protein
LLIQVGAFGVGGEECGVFLGGHVKVLIDLARLAKLQFQHAFLGSVADAGDTAGLYRNSLHSRIEPFRALPLRSKLACSSADPSSPQALQEHPHQCRIGIAFDPHLPQFDVNRARLWFREVGEPMLHRQRRRQTLAHSNRHQLDGRLGSPSLPARLRLNLTGKCPSPLQVDSYLTSPLLQNDFLLPTCLDGHNPTLTHLHPLRPEDRENSSYAHKQDIGAATRRSPKGTGLPPS